MGSDISPWDPFYASAGYPIYSFVSQKISLHRGPNLLSGFITCGSRASCDGETLVVLSLASKKVLVNGSLSDRPWPERAYYDARLK